MNKNHDSYFSKLLIAAAVLLLGLFSYLLILNAAALIGALVCFSGSYVAFFIFAKFSRRDITILAGNALFLFAFGWVGIASTAIAHAHLMTYGNFLSAMGDDLGFLMNAQHFAESGELTYSIFDFFTGALYFFYNLVGVPVDVLCLLPINWGASALLVVLSHVFVSRMCGGVSKPWLFCLSLIGNYTFILVSVLFVRDILGALFFLLALACAFSRMPFQATIASALAFGVRGANGFLGVFMLPFGMFSNLFAGKRVLLAVTLVFLSISGVYFGNFAMNYLGSVVRVVSSEGGNLLEQRAAMMRNQDDMNFQGGGRFDMTMMFYKMGPVGVPFRYVSNLFAPIRMAPAEGMVRVQGRSSKNKMYGKFRQAWYQNLHVLILPFVVPYLILGLYEAYKNPKFNSFLFAFLLVLTCVVIFSVQDRHRAIFIVFYPVFVELGARACAAGPSKKLAFLGMIGLVALLYPLNLYLMLR